MKKLLVVLLSAFVVTSAVARPSMDHVNDTTASGSVDQVVQAAGEAHKQNMLLVRKAVEIGKKSANFYKHVKNAANGLNQSNRELQQHIGAMAE